MAMTAAMRYHSPLLGNTFFVVVVNFNIAFMIVGIWGCCLVFDKERSIRIHSIKLGPSQDKLSPISPITHEYVSRDSETVSNTGLHTMNLECIPWPDMRQGCMLQVAHLFAIEIQKEILLRNLSLLHIMSWYHMAMCHGCIAKSSSLIRKELSVSLFTETGLSLGMRRILWTSRQQNGLVSSRLLGLLAHCIELVTI
jgi:hypothetical protein